MLEILDLKRRGLYYPCSENKGSDQLLSNCEADADQLRSYCEAGLRLCFVYALACCFSHDTAQITSV